MPGVRIRNTFAYPQINDLEILFLKREELTRTRAARCGYEEPGVEGLPACSAEQSPHVCAGRTGG